MTEERPPEFKTMTFELDVVEYSPEFIELLTGGKVAENPATHSLELTTKHVVSGGPPRPTRLRGLRAWLTRANRCALKAWRAEYDVWVAEGRPDREVFLTTFIPRVRLTSVAEEAKADVEEESP